MELLESPFEPRDRHLHPEEQAIRRIEKQIMIKWEAASKAGKSYFPHEYFYQILRDGSLEKVTRLIQALLVAGSSGKNLPIVVPGWEDSTLGNIFPAFDAGTSRRLLEDRP